MIDLSGDVASNGVGSVEEVRDRATTKGATPSGPVIEGGDPGEIGVAPPATLEDYDRRSVPGRQGAFVLAVAGFEEFPGAIRRKPVHEVAGTHPSAGAKG